MNGTPTERFSERFGAEATQELEQWLTHRLQEKGVSREEYRESR